MKQKKFKAFTLLEMLVVVFIIGVLILLFLPNITKQQETITKTGDESIIKVVETQTEMYLLANPDKKSVTVEELVAAEYLKPEQAKRYNEAKKNDNSL